MTQILGPEGFCYPLKIPRIVYPATLVPHQPGNYVHMDYGSVQDLAAGQTPARRRCTATVGSVRKASRSHGRFRRHLDSPIVLTVVFLSAAALSRVS